MNDAQLYKHINSVGKRCAEGLFLSKCRPLPTTPPLFPPVKHALCGVSEKTYLALAGNLKASAQRSQLLLEEQLGRLVVLVQRAPESGLVLREPLMPLVVKRPVRQQKEFAKQSCTKRFVGTGTLKWAQKLDHKLRCMCDGLRANPLSTKWIRRAGHPVGQPPYRTRSELPAAYGLPM